jgi:hypothetical protein
MIRSGGQDAAGAGGSLVLLRMQPPVAGMLALGTASTWAIRRPGAVQGPSG